ncbi:MAG: c-type cytochrome [Microthrixaceae bacterium]
MIVLATTQRIIGYIIFAVVVAGFVVWLVTNLRGARAEAGSEIELAPNRRPYLTDDELETKQLNLALFSAAGLLAIIGVALPLYWLAEPGRQAGAKEMYQEIFVERGFELYETGAQCVACHGGNGSGGSATFIINDQNGQFVDQVSWIAPALDNVLYRYSEEGVRYVLNYGRPGTPMAAWGAPGGGPLTTQQIDNIIDYLWTVQVSPKQLRSTADDFIKQIDEGLYDRMLKVRKSNEKVTDALKANRLSREDELALGEILFNNQSLASGSYSCARCHVPGAAFGKAYTSFSRVPMSAFGPDLAGVENEATQQQHFDLVNTGMVPGIGYFSRKQGNPQMPAFGTNPNAGQADKGIPDKGPEGMLSIEQLWAVVRYERNLSNDSTVKSAVAGTAESPTFAGGK